MAYLCRNLIAANQLVQSSICRFPLIQARQVVMKVQPAKPEVAEGFDERNMRLKRPLSPHLLIYKPQFTSMFSITHRITGCALAVYAIGFAAFSVSPGSFPHLVEAIQAVHIPAPVVFSGKLVLAFPAAYHTCCGIRHLFWDFAKGLTIKEVYSTSYALAAATVTLTIILASL